MLSRYFKRDEKGFTLIELLIVVAIIGILAAIAIPNLVAAQRRAKYARTAGDTKTIVTQSMVYINDNNCAPAAVSDLWDLTGPESSVGCTTLTTVVPGYMSQVKDPFATASDYGFGSALAGISYAFGMGSDATTAGWDGDASMGTSDDLGNSSKDGCVKGSDAAVPKGAC